MEALRPGFDGLILYGYDPDITPVIVGEANKLAYRAILLGIDNPKSDMEISGVAQLIRQYHGRLALAVCIGNEGIAFNKYSFGNLRTVSEKLNKMLGSGIRVPVCTSEPFSEYGQTVLREYGDFLSPNIHPVFDADQLGAVEAAGWVHERALALAEKAQKPVLVKETGLPHGSADRFTPEAQQMFWSAYVHRGLLLHISSNLRIWCATAFEAFDLGWKAELANSPLEREWGLLTSDRKPFPAFYVWKRIRRIISKRLTTME